MEGDADFNRDFHSEGWKLPHTDFNTTFLPLSYEEYF